MSDITTTGQNVTPTPDELNTRRIELLEKALAKAERRLDEIGDTLMRHSHDARGQAVAPVSLHHEPANGWVVTSSYQKA